jgi:EmrB/QacA subfamily drug resistance transporter
VADVQLNAAATGDRTRWWALVVVCLAMFMNALDSSIVNVALPDIQRDLHFTQSGLTWVVDAFLITFASMLLMAGRLGDLVGRKRVFLSGVALFTLSSVMCGVAPDQAVLIVGRFLQGAGGALSASVIVAIIVTEFPAGADRARAMSAYIFVAVGGGSIGLLVGGIITQTLSWHWIFFINVPVGIFTFVFGRLLIDENVGLGVRGGVDVTGSVLVTAALMVGVYAIVTATSYGWVSVHTIGIGALALLLLGSFLVLEMRLDNPIVPLRILRIRSLTTTSIVRGFLATGMFSTFFLGALYLEKALGYSPIQTGVAFLPMSLSMALMSAGITRRLVDRFGVKPVLLPATLAAAAGLVILARAGTHPTFAVDILPGFVLIGLGAGASFIPLLTMAMAEVPHEDAGLGSGIVNVSMQMAAAVGLAILSTVAADRSRSLVASGVDRVGALVGGYRLSLLLAAGFVLVGTVLTIVVLPDVPTELPDQEPVPPVH